MASNAETYSLVVLQEIAQFVMARTRICPKVGIICASHLGWLLEKLDSIEEIAYEDIPHFPKNPFGAGDSSKMAFGCLDGFPIVAMQRRFYYHEGHSLQTCTMPIRVMKLIGVTHLIITNHGRALNPNFKVGDIMVLRDHINFMNFGGNNPLRGISDREFGPRAVSMTNSYDPCLVMAAMKHAKTIDIGNKVHEGVYAAVSGPSFESIAEAKCLRALGADVVGMSTAPETIVARHSGLIVFGFSLIIALSSIDYDMIVPESTDKERQRNANKFQEDCIRMLSGVVRKICE